MVKPLGSIPWMSLGLKAILKVASRQIYSDTEAKHGRKALLRREVSPTTGQGGDEFNLIVKVLSCTWIGQGDRLTGRTIDNRVSRFGEKEWRLAVVRTHFPRMGSTITADAIDAPNWKHSLRTTYGKDRPRGRCDGVSRHRCRIGPAQIR